MDIKNEIFNSIETIFSKVYKSPLNSDGLERLRGACNKLYEAVRHTADKASVDRCQKLNDATKEGFIKTSEALQSEYNERVEAFKALEQRIKALEEKMHISFTNVKELIDLNDPYRKIG